ncbi:hypothetical protein SCA6_000399 [Theobroma cacao]
MVYFCSGILGIKGNSHGKTNEVTAFGKDPVAIHLVVLVQHHNSIEQMPQKGRKGHAIEFKGANIV